MRTECFALLVGALLSVAHFGYSAFHFLSDCQSALGIVSGLAVGRDGGAAGAAANLHCLRRDIAPSADTYSYVPGHAGLLPNEIVDKLSKAGASETRASCGLHVTPDIMRAWLVDGVHRIPWLGTAVRALVGDSALPPLNTAQLGHDADHGNLEPPDLIRPFAPSGTVDLDRTGTERAQAAFSRCSGAAAAGETCVQDSFAHARCVILQCTLASYNALSLLGEVDREISDNQAQLQTRKLTAVGRAAVLAETLAAHEVDIAFLQETRCPKGRCQTGAYLRFASGALRGQWGTEIWLRSGAPFFSAATSKQHQSVSVCTLISRQ